MEIYLRHEIWTRQKGVRGENCRRQFARESSPDSYAVTAEVPGPRNVAESLVALAHVPFCAEERSDVPET